MAEWRWSGGGAEVDTFRPSEKEAQQRLFELFFPKSSSVGDSGAAAKQLATGSINIRAEKPAPCLRRAVHAAPKPLTRSCAERGHDCASWV